MDNFEGEIPEIQDFLYRHRVTSHGRRRTVHVTERSQTAIGLLRTTESPVIKPLTTKHVSLTPSPTRKDHVQFEHIGYSALPNRRYSSYVASSRTVTSHHLIKKCKSDLLTNRHRVHTHHILTPFSQRNGHFAYARQKSRVFSVQEEDVVRKDTDDTEDDAPIPEASLKQLLAKFKLAVNLTIFCSRQFKKHCLRLNEHNDELSPYIKRLHFHEDDHHSTDDLLIDLSKFKANRQMRVPEETKRILSKEVSERTEHEVYTVTLALRNIKSFSEYPKRMQKKIAEVGLYEKYESKRMIIRQGHPASAFYFILSGAVVIMVMDEDSKYARPVAHLYKGQTFGELAIINETKRNSTVIAKETCEFMSISVRGYHKIFMAGGVKNISDPDQEIFLKSLTCLAAWPIQILQQNPNKCQFLFFKNGEVIVRDSHYSDWLIIVKSGSIEVLKKLKRVQAFEWKRKKATEIVQGSKKREIIIKRIQWRRVLPEISIPLNPDEDFENVELLNNGHPMPFVHPDDDNDIAPKEKHVKKQPQIPNLWPFKVDLSEIESGRYLDDNRGTGQTPRIQTIPENINVDGKWQGKQLNRLNSKELLGIKQRGRSNSMVQEEEKELLGYQPHIRTIMEDIDGGMKRRDSEDINPADINPEFVHVQTLTKGQVFGLADLIITDQPNFSVVSRGADCLLINKQFYIDNASERLLLDVRHELCPYPTEEELQERLQVSVDWQAYKKSMLLESLENVSSRRVIRTTLNGTKA